MLVNMSTTASHSSHILSHINSVHDSTTCLFNYSLTLSPILRLGLSGALFQSNCPSKTLCAPLSPIHASSPAHLSFLFYHQMVFGDGSRLCTSGGRSFHKSGLLEAAAR